MWSLLLARKPPAAETAAPKRAPLPPCRCRLRRCAVESAGVPRGELIEQPATNLRVFSDSIYICMQVLKLLFLAGTFLGSDAFCRAHRRRGCRPKEAQRQPEQQQQRHWRDRLNDRPDGSGNRILGLPRRHAPDLWEGFSGSAAAVRLCPAAKYSPSDCSSRETPTGGVQIYKPAQIQAWQDFLRTQDGFVSLQILAQPPADYDSAAVAAEPEGEHSGAILLIERWRSHEARDAAEAAARTRIAQEGQEPQQLLLSEALAWPSHVDMQTRHTFARQLRDAFHIERHVHREIFLANRHSTHQRRLRRLHRKRAASHDSARKGDLAIKGYLAMGIDRSSTVRRAA
ncbi:hypothetical protein cyc_07109 [Cyclospora cayetanensis]|uniref:Uncharacterized protein n=1 Tax=Cyclospora cayetanensis TaxID=88456 RepID=A0A1D3CUM8_9EIME|nr:hypothetical protein cyc_07109 [Cyclospora cayetanensis]